MFQRIAVPILGMVENMSYHQCKSCGHREFVFGEHGALRTAHELGMDVLGQVGQEQRLTIGFPQSIASIYDTQLHI